MFIKNKQEQFYKIAEMSKSSIFDITEDKSEEILKAEGVVTRFQKGKNVPSREEKDFKVTK